MKKYILITFSLALTILACKKENPELGDPPTIADAQFTYAPSTQSPNVIELTAANSTILCMWDFGNGVKGQGNNVTATYPYAGTYTVKLTVFNKGGSASSSKEIVIAEDDLTLLNNPYFNMLTGGVDGPGYKVWHVDSVSAAHVGVGPDPESALGATPEWWSSNPNEKPGCGLYDDRYVFHLNGFKYDMITNGDVYIHNSLSSSFPGSYENLFDYTAPFTSQLNQSWQIVEGSTVTLSVSGNSFIGFYTGVNSYRILDMTDNTLYLQYKHHSGGLHWYLKLKSE
jgi:PKD repeat protein